MKTLELIQGSIEWHKHRATHFNASDTAAMLGISTYKTRNSLLHEIATGIIPEIDSFTQKMFDNGHRFEALARPIAEKIIGDDLSPTVGVDGNLSASFDGITFDGTVIFEHKTLNDSLREALSKGIIPIQYHPQIEQQLLISQAEKCLFLASLWDDDDNLVEELHVWYYPDMALRKRILDGWDLFAVDLENYKHADKTIAPVGITVKNLPSITYKIDGLSVVSNIADVVRPAVIELIDRHNKMPVTDQEFADLDSFTKCARESVQKSKDVRSVFRSQFADIDAFERSLVELEEMLTDAAIKGEKIFKQEKLNRKFSLVDSTQKKLNAHMASLAELIFPIKLMVEISDFKEAIKGLSSFSSIENALESALVKAKLDSSAVANDIRAKLDWFNANDSGKAYLFPDLQQIIYKQRDEFELTVTSRIETQIADEEARFEKRSLAMQDAADRKYKAIAEEITIGEINRRLGFVVTAEFLLGIGFTAQTDRDSILYCESDFPLICNAIIRHINGVTQQHNWSVRNEN